MMADDGTLPSGLPDEPLLAARARAAGVNVDALSFPARVRVLREFRTEGEQSAIAATAQRLLDADAKRFNDVFAQEGFWHEGWNQW